MIRFVGAMGVALALVAAPLAQSNVAGSWALTINGPQGTVNADAVIKQDGEKLTGTMNSPQGEVPMTGTIAGSALKLAFSVSTPQGVIDVSMTADVDGNGMKGNLDFGMGVADFTGKKK